MKRSKLLLPIIIVLEVDMDQTGKRNTCILGFALARNGVGGIDESVFAGGKFNVKRSKRK